MPALPIHFAAALAMLAAASSAFGQMPSRESGLVFQIPAAPGLELGGNLELDRGSVEILENGEPRDVLAVERVEDRWRIVVYFDLPASTPEGVAAAAAAVDAAADRLAALGEVEVIVTDRIAEVVLEPTADAGALREAAASVAERADEAGGVLALRREMRGAAAAGAGGRADGPRAADLLEAFLQELDTLARQRANLLEALGTDRAASAESPWAGSPWRQGPPRVLFLVRDGMDVGTGAFARRLLGRTTPAFQRAAVSEQRRQRSLERTVAALGWRVYALHAAPPLDPLRQPNDPRAEGGDLDELLPDRFRDADAFAQASGGRVLTSAEELAAAISRLGASWRARYVSTGSRDGTPHPVDARVLASSGGRPPPLDARRWGTVTTPSDLAALRANRALETMAGSFDTITGSFGGHGTGAAGLALRGALLLQGVETTTADGAPAERAAVDGLATFGDEPPESSDALRITIYGRGLDAPPLLVHRTGGGAALDRGAWRFRALFDLPAAIDELVLMVEDLRRDRWRAALLEPGEGPLDEGSGVESLLPDGAPGGDGAANADSTGDTSASATDADDAGEDGVLAERNLVRLLPPRGERSGLRGRQSFGTVTTSNVVRRVEFYLDDELVFEDKRKPFEARIDLGAEAVPHVVRIVGYDRADRRLAEDELPINQPRGNPEIEIVSIEARPGGRYAIEARVELAAERRLDRVEFYRNDRLAATVTRPPFRTVLPGPAAPGADFALVAVHLDDGTKIEEVKFLSTDAAAAETFVNLVEVYVVVTDEDGKPVTTLEREDFTLFAGREEVPIERFAVAEDVPLVLGLAVDSSGSMRELMPEARMAAARFLGNTLTELDQAFLVDFDNEPRLIADTTPDVGALIASLDQFEANGSTALYDAMEFSLVQLARDQGRRALVVLTDGDDAGSQSTYRRTLRTAENTGVPIYAISMSPGDPMRPGGPGPGGFGAGSLGLGGFGRQGGRKLDLEAIAEASGGRAYYVDGMDAVLQAYERIGAELRSQYMLGYSTGAPLTAKQVQSLQVELASKRPRKFGVRIAVGRGRG